MLAGVLLAGGAIAQVKPPASFQPPTSFQPDARSKEIAAQNRAVLDRLTPVTDAMLRDPPPGDWLQWRRTYDEHGFSPLDQVNRQNVHMLRLAWAWSLPQSTSEIVPTVHDGIMFVFTFQDRVQALDARTGELLWEYVRPPLTGPAWPGQAGTYRRNLTIYGNKIVFPTFDGYEVALDYKTGKVVWEHKFSDRATAYRASSGPLPAKGKLIQGTTNCARLQPGGCFVFALDAETGNEVWRVNTIARPGEKGDETWNGAPLADRQGGGIWATPSYDPELGLAFVGIGNTYDWQGLVRGDTKIGPKKAGLFTNSTLAIDPDTGKVKWFYQHMPQDMWNQDWAFERIVATLPVNGSPRKLVVTTGKDVITDALDAASGKWAFSIDQGVQNVVKSIDPKTGRKIYDPAVIPDLAGKSSFLLCPGSAGAKNWNSSAYDASTHLLYVVYNVACAQWMPRTYSDKEPYAGGEQQIFSQRYLPGSNGNVGYIDAIDLTTRKTVWTKRQRSIVSSAALATAGGLLFAGDADRWFRAYDSATGDVLWQARLNDSIHSFPISFSVDGKQYIAVEAGYSGPLGARLPYIRGLTPEVRTPANAGPVMWVFELAEPMRK
jgi:alcohol dehydrogenase (cytochrome c)